MLVEVGNKKFKSFRAAAYHFMFVEHDSNTLNKLAEAQTATDSFIKPNKKAPDVYHKLINGIIERFRVEFRNILQRMKPALKKAESTGEFRDVVMNARNLGKALYFDMIRPAYLIGRERAIAALKKRGLMEADDAEPSIEFETKTVIGLDGKEREILVPVLNMNLTPLDLADEKRITDLTYGGGYLEKKLNELAGKAAEWDAASEEEKDMRIDEWVDGLDPYAKYVSNDMWIAGEVAAHAEFGDWEKTMADYRDFEGGNPVQYIWSGPEDGDSCEDCLQDMADSPYDSIDECPVPGEDTQCGPNCRHFVVLGDAEGNEQAA